MDKTIVILNPSAAQGKTIKEKEEIESVLSKYNIDYQIYISKSATDIKEATLRYINSGYKNFIGVGGDGTLHYMAKILAGTDCNLGIISTGSGNDIIKSFGIKKDIEENIRIIKQGKISRIDLGLYNNKEYYIGVAGSGFDSETTKFANETKLPLKGMARYNFAVYKTLITYKSKFFNLEYDSVKRTINIMMMVVSNLKYYGGGMKITPDADAYDSKFDVCLIKSMSKLTFIKSFPKVYEGSHLQLPQVEIFRTSEINIDCDYKFDVYGDGEYMGKLPANFKIAPKMLNIFLP
ncbi:MAG: diacylglycerol kinase family lipid kinase [Actinobacteria bacterium]|nr:diacylglycerol kinase family lipid kinase [Actinomycetota bacterium]